MLVRSYPLVTLTVSLSATPPRSSALLPAPYFAQQQQYAAYQQLQVDAKQLERKLTTFHITLQDYRSSLDGALEMYQLINQVISLSFVFHNFTFLMNLN